MIPTARVPLVDDPLDFARHESSLQQQLLLETEVNNIRGLTFIYFEDFLYSVTRLLTSYQFYDDDQDPSNSMDVYWICMSCVRVD